MKYKFIGIILILLVYLTPLSVSPEENPETMEVHLEITPSLDVIEGYQWVSFDVDIQNNESRTIDIKNVNYLRIVNIWVYDENENLIIESFYILSQTGYLTYGMGRDYDYLRVNETYDYCEFNYPLNGVSYKNILYESELDSAREWEWLEFTTYQPFTEDGNYTFVFYVENYDNSEGGWEIYTGSVELVIRKTRFSCESNFMI